MLSPEDIKKIDLDNVDLAALEAEIDQSILDFHGWYSYEKAFIYKEYPVEVRNYIAERYKEKGWKYVYHQTSSENGERPGLTDFIFSNEEVSEEIVGKYHKV